MKKLYISFLFVIIASVSVSNGEFGIQKECDYINGIHTDCISIKKCRFANVEMTRGPVRHLLGRALRLIQCGFDQFIPYVCCSDALTIDDILSPTEIPEISTTTEYIVTEKQTDPVTIEVTKPTTVLATEATTTKSAEIGSPYVENEYPFFPLGKCGYNSQDNKILGGEITDLEEFPWIARIGYNKFDGSVGFECAGVLINRRYVLTAAHCLVGEVRVKVGKPALVRLGEYNTTTEIDCITYGRQRECADPVVDVYFEKTIVHPGYNDKSSNKKDDIALIRLSKEVEMTNYIQPICLSNETLNVANDDDLFVAGWGRTENSKKSQVKLKVAVPKFDSQKCGDKFKTRSIQLTNGQICAGGIANKDACRGDSGGPLMVLRNDVWYSYGIVSAGIGCGIDGWPGLYTSIEQYMDWIKTNIMH